MSSETSIPGGRPFPSLRELTGAVIDNRYEVGRLLGCGGMGAVYEAMQLRLDRRVAIKILNPVYMHRDDYVTRFMREAKAASRIRHENVVQVLDFGELPSGSVYSVMEFLEGRDLAQLLQREFKLPWPRTRDLLLQMARGLKAAHAEGVIHRDIKPANLFLVPDPEENRDILKVLDFGIARLQTSTSHTAGLTGTAELLGTPSYMAPELARGRAANPRSEVYSVGVVAYRMVTGHLPFEGQTAFDVLFRSATEPAPPLRTHEPNVPPAVEALVMRMLAKDPEERFADMATLYREVAAIDDQGRVDASAVLATGPQATVDRAIPAGFAAPTGAPPSLPTVPSGPLPGPGATAPTLREATLIASDPGAGPQIVVPPPLSVSPSTRAALAATRAARASTSSVVLRLDAEPTHPGPGVEATPTPGSSASVRPSGSATLPVGDPYLQSDSASGNVRLLPGGSGMEALPSGTTDLHELRAIAGAKVPRWLVATVLGVVAVVAIIAFAATRGDDPPAEPPSAAPTIIAAPSVVPDEVEGEVPPVSAPASEAGAPAVVPSPPADPAEAREEEDAEPLIIEDEHEPAPSGRASEPATSRPASASPRPKADPPAEKVVTDAQVVRRLQRQAQRKCGMLLGGESLTVNFGIGQNGEVLFPRASRSGAAAKCVLAIVDEAEFAAGKMRAEVLKL